MINHNFNVYDFNRVWFTSDNHFGHENIIRFCNRPFISSHEMDCAMIDNWNKVVKPQDIVYHLGDVTLGDNAMQYLEKLNGAIYIIETPWHHDKRWLQKQKNEIEYEAVHPGYEKQKEAFTELFTLYRDLRFKTPRVPIMGQKLEDILHEEALVFDHDTQLRWFGSSEKQQKFGIQDDAMYSLAWCIYGGRTLPPDALRERKGTKFFGAFYMADGHLGAY